MEKTLYQFRVAAFVIVSATTIAYEIAVMRIFSVGSWSNFGSMVISIALLGIGLAGTTLTLAAGRIRAHADHWLATLALILGPAMAGAQIGAQYVPFNPILITVDATQIAWIALYYLIYAVPFFIAALFIGIVFVELQTRVHRVYFWNMIGSGAGGGAILGLMYILPPGSLVAPLVVAAALAATFSFMRHDAAHGAIGIPLRALAAVGIVLIASVASLAAYGRIQVSQFKPISYARLYPDATLVYHSYGPTGVYDVYQSSYFHFAPGLSDNASLDIKSMPQNAFLGLYIDGEGPAGVIRALTPDEEAYMDFLPVAAPYAILKNPSVLELRLGGGIGLADALYHGASTVTVAEPDPVLIHILKDIPFFQRYNGGMLNNPRVHIVNKAPRAFAAATNQRFDLVEIGLIDSVGLSRTGGYPLTENYTYTVQGIESYLHALTANGILSITVWNTLDPPMNVPKLLATVTEALQARGVQTPGRHIFAFDSLLSTATILVKNSAFTSSDITALRGFLAKTSFVPAYYPGMPAPTSTLSTVLHDYYREVATPNSTANPQPIPENLYYYTIASLLAGKANQLYGGYPLNIRPATDNRPYYTGYVKPSTLPIVLNDMQNLPEEWGYALQFWTFIISVIFGLMIIALPLVFRRKKLFNKRKGTMRVIVYYAALGVGYMFVEIFLIQRLTFFVDNMVYASTIVLSAMLAISGIGALTAERYSRKSERRRSRRRLVAYAAAGIIVSLFFYIAIMPSMIDALLGLAIAWRILIAIAFIAPGAFFLGVPFPTGLSALSENRSELLPWAWGMNGALSVAGTTLAALVSVTWGFAIVLVAAAMLYFLAYITFSGNEAPAQRIS